MVELLLWVISFLGVIMIGMIAYIQKTLNGLSVAVGKLEENIENVEGWMKSHANRIEKLEEKVK